MIDSPGHGRHSYKLCKSVIVYLLILSSTELTNYLICLTATVVTVRVRMIPDFYITIMRTYFPGVMNEFNTSSWKTRWNIGKDERLLSCQYSDIYFWSILNHRGDFPTAFLYFFFVAETNYWTRLNLKFLDLQNDLVILIFRRIINHLKSEAFYHIFYTTWEIFLWIIRLAWILVETRFHCYAEMHSKRRVHAARTLSMFLNLMNHALFFSFKTFICHINFKFNTQISFLYTTPYDTVLVNSFLHFKFIMLIFFWCIYRYEMFFSSNIRNWIY